MQEGLFVGEQTKAPEAAIVRSKRLQTIDETMT